MPSRGKKKAEVVPLVAGGYQPKSSRATQSSQPTSSRRSAQRQSTQRDERRPPPQHPSPLHRPLKKRDVVPVEISTSTKSNEQSEPQKITRRLSSWLSSDGEDDYAGPTCCHKFGRFLVKFIHYIDGLVGLTFVIYGTFIYFSFEQPAMEAVIFSLTYGCTLLFASTIGLIGFYTKTVCGRCGLAISAYMAPFIAFFYMFVIIAMLASPDELFNYLDEHKDVLFLNDAQLATLKQLLPFFYVVLACLTLLEICR